MIISFKNELRDIPIHLTARTLPAKCLPEGRFGTNSGRRAFISCAISWPLG
jgi:hypothetical protein